MRKMDNLEVECKSIAKDNRKWTWKKPKDKPKRPLSAYNLFFQKEKNSIMKQRKESKVVYASLAGLVSDRWGELKEEERKPYEDEAKKLKVQYDIAVKLWSDRRESTKMTKSHHNVAKSTLTGAIGDNGTNVRVFVSPDSHTGKTVIGKKSSLWKQPLETVVKREASNLSYSGQGITRTSMMSRTGFETVNKDIILHN
jgi:adenine-specific DNA glycosylase